jgi:hypothetical protein
LIFALVGLYLRIEKGLSGKQVQQVHMRLGRRKRNWPAIRLPHERGAMTAEDVLTVPAGAERDDAIDAWCKSVWEAFVESRETIVELLREHQIT